MVNNVDQCFKRLFNNKKRLIKSLNIWSIYLNCCQSSLKYHYLLCLGLHYIIVTKEILITVSYYSRKVNSKINKFTKKIKISNKSLMTNYANILRDTYTIRKIIRHNSGKKSVIHIQLQEKILKLYLNQSFINFVVAWLI